MKAQLQTIKLTMKTKTKKNERKQNLYLHKQKHLVSYFVWCFILKSVFTLGVLMCWNICCCFSHTHAHTQILFDNIHFGYLNAYTIEGDVDFRSRRNLLGWHSPRVEWNEFHRRTGGVSPDVVRFSACAGCTPLLTHSTQKKIHWYKQTKKKISHQIA